MKKFLVRYSAATFAALVVALSGCGGGGGGSAPVDTGSGGGGGTTTPPAATVTGVVTPTAQAVSLAATVGGESCATCHSGDAAIARTGPGHQADYDQLYQNGVIKVTNLAFAQTTKTATGDTSVVSFKMTKNGAPFDCTTADTIGSYWAAYDPATNTFPSDLSMGSKTAYNAATGVCTITNTVTAAGDIATLNAIAGGANGEITLYGADEVLEKPAGTHLQKARYPFAAILRLGPVMGAATSPFVSAANVSGCEACHTQPFNKHAYIPGTVDDNTPGAAAGTTQQFYVCKGCHYDQRVGHDPFWQLLGEAKLADPKTTAGQALRNHAAAVNAGTDQYTATETTKYAYKARLMNDVHMSHSMEFPYPQSMRNCVTCHAGKMDETTGIFKPANFRAETCISCHTVDGITAKMKAASYPHTAILADLNTLRTTDCTGCHGQFAPTFKTIHTGGYDPKIYTADGVRYSDTFKVTINSATYANNVLDVKFSATGSTGTYQAANIQPTVMVGLYGYNTKDWVVYAHGNAADGKKNLEHLWGDGNPRFTDVSAANGAWEVKIDLSLWKDMIGTGKAVKRAEIAILPKLGSATMTEVEYGNPNPVPMALGLDAPSRTFDLVNNKFDDTFYTDLVNVKKTTVAGPVGNKIVGCNTCHDQLATTFHTGIRGGNIRVCRLCHDKSNPAGSFELQSRSIDSFVHAIHSFQYMSANSVDFSDPFQAMEYQSHTETEFPRFGLGDGATDCESCHVKGAYGVPDQSKSLPAVVSGSYTLKNMTNPIGTYQANVVGPAANACGSCHRSQKIVEGDAGGLSTLWAHWTQNGYVVGNVSTLWNAIVAKVMAPFQ